MISKQTTLDIEDLEKVVTSYLNNHWDGKITDNPHLCFRWLFNTCKNNHVCANNPDSMPCNDFTMREDEALGII